MQKVEPSNREFAVATLGMLVILGFINWGVYDLLRNLLAFFVSVHQKTAVEPTTAAALPMLIIGFSVNLFAVSIAFKVVTKDRYTKRVKKLLVCSGIGCLLGAALVFTNPIVHYALNNYAEKQGYHVCKNDRGWKWLMFRTQYVLDPKECRKN